MSFEGVDFGDGERHFGEKREFGCECECGCVGCWLLVVGEWRLLF